MNTLLVKRVVIGLGTGVAVVAAGVIGKKLVRRDVDQRVIDADFAEVDIEEQEFIEE